MHLLAQNQSSTPSQQSILTDGRYTCTYEDIPVLFTSIARQLHRVKVALEDVVALECENSLLHALTLLYLLESGNSVLVLSRRQTARYGHKHRVAPAFCRYLV